MTSEEEDRRAGRQRAKPEPSHTPQPQPPRQPDGPKTQPAASNQIPADAVTSKPGTAQLVHGDLDQAFKSTKRSLRWAGLAGLLALATGVGIVLVLTLASVDVVNFGSYLLVTVAIISISAGPLTICSAFFSTREVRKKYNEEIRKKYNEEIAKGTGEGDWIVSW